MQRLKRFTASWGIIHEYTVDSFNWLDFHWRGLLSIMVYLGRLPPKGYHFLASGTWKGGNFKYTKEDWDLDWVWHRILELPLYFLFLLELHAYLLTSPGGKSPEQDLYSLLDYRISASLTQISLVHASYHHGTNGGRSAILKKSTAELDSGLLGLLILCGDISSNPGPKCKHPCEICSKTVRSNQRAVQCDSCNAWYHVKCM